MIGVVTAENDHIIQLTSIYIMRSFMLAPLFLLSEATAYTAPRLPHTVRNEAGRILQHSRELHQRALSPLPHRATRADVIVEIDAEVVNLPGKAVTPVLVAQTNDDVDNGGDFDPSGLLWRASIFALCALWASNFAAVKLVTAEPGVDSALYAVSRFGLAALVLLPGSISAARKGVIDFETAKGAAVCGGWVALGYLGQTLGLLTTTASRSCVICSLHCVFVAALAEYTRVSGIWKKGNDDASFDIVRLLPAFVAVAGVAIIELWGAGGDPTIGDLFSFAQPIGFGLGYVQLEELMRKKPEAALPVSAIKLTVVTLASLIFFEVSPLILSSGGTLSNLSLRVPNLMPIVSSPTALGGILYTGIVTTALALWFESIAFKRVPAKDASIILSTEPLFAAAAGATFLGETFGMTDYIGAGLIVGACVLSILHEDEAADENCDPYVDEGCAPPRTWPFMETIFST